MPDKLDPTVLDTLPPADTMRYIAAWSAHAALDTEAPSCHDALVQVWTAIVHSGPQARTLLQRSLDAAQRLDLDQR